MPRLNILCVDSDAVLRKALKFFLTGHNCTVDTTENAFNALSYIAIKRYHILLCEYPQPYNVPSPDFFKTLRSLYPETLNILMTNYHDRTEELRDGSIVGIDFTLIKPFTITTIENFLTLLRKKSARTSNSFINPACEPVPSHAPHLRHLEFP